MHTKLHWLDVPERINYKLGMLMYRCQHNNAPRYLMDHCTSVSDVAYRQRLRVCYKLLERIILHRVTPKVEELLSEDQAGFRRGRSMCVQPKSTHHIHQEWFSEKSENGSCLPGPDSSLRHDLAYRPTRQTHRKSPIMVHYRC